MTAARGSRPVLVPAGAMGCAALMIAYHVASRAMRDTLFLSNFDFARLPAMVAVASVLSIVVALLATRAIATYGPARVILAGFAMSAALTLGEWWLATRDAGVASVAVYLHVAVLSSALVSGFWSILTEDLDPRSAKRVIGRIAGFGTLGGLLGGLLAERITAWSGVSATLPALALMHASCAWLLFRMAGSAPAATAGAGEAIAMSAGEAARRLVATSYLRNLARLIRRRLPPRRHLRPAAAARPSERRAHAAARGRDSGPGLAGAPCAPRPDGCITIGAAASRLALRDGGVRRSA